MQNLLEHKYALGGLIRAEAVCGAGSDGVFDIYNSVVVLSWGLYIPVLVFMP